MNEQGKKVFITYDSVFLNSDSLFIEYNDVIKSPFFTFLLSAQNNEDFNTLFDTTPIKGLNKMELYEWYQYRNDQSLFLSLEMQPEVKELFNSDDLIKTWCNEYLYGLLDSHPELVEFDTTHIFVNTLTNIMKTTMVNKYYVYTPIYSKSIENDLHKLFNKEIIYVHGNLVDVLKENNISSNSTFVFSDIKKLIDLKEANILNGSSILIADKYGYNYKYKELVIDVNEVCNGHIFKLNFFNNN